MRQTCCPDVDGFGDERSEVHVWIGSTTWVSAAEVFAREGTDEIRRMIREHLTEAFGRPA